MPFSQYWRLVDIMARMSLRADATKFVLGYVWWVLEPLLYVAVLYVVFTVILTNRHPDFLMFLMTGKLAFVWFSKSITQAGSSIVNGRGLVGKIKLPMSLFPMSMVQECMYRQIAVFAFLITVLMFNGYPMTATWIYIVPVLLVNYIMILSLALLAASIVTVVRDFAPLIALAMIFLMFTSGIFWDVRGFNDPAKTDLLLSINPLAFILDAYRQVLMYATPPDMFHLLSIGAGFGALLCVAVLIMRRGGQFLALKSLTS
ncbi:MAG: ABC transporter permease [Halioglobus sp.]|nr:ABC transporter permease [Halioglobus sp.]